MRSLLVAFALFAAGCGVKEDASLLVYAHSATLTKGTNAFGSKLDGSVQVMFDLGKWTQGNVTVEAIQLGLYRDTTQVVPAATISPPDGTTFPLDFAPGQKRTLAYTIKKEWPELLGSPEAQKVADRTFEAMEFIERLRREKTLAKDFTKGYGKVAYHAACHLRAQKIGTPGARILGLLPDTEVDIIEKCSAVDGTWGMQARFHDASMQVAQGMLRRIEEAEPQHVATDCPLAALRIQEGSGRKAVHPVVLMRHAYGLGTE